MPDNIEQLEKKIRMLQEDFEDFSFSVNKKIGSTGSREVQAKIKNGSTVLIGSSNSAFRADQNGIYLGNATFASAPFRVTMAGALTATSATITGGAAGGWTIDATSIYTGTEDHSGYTATAGDITIYSNGTDASIHAKNWYIDTAGVLTCTGATVAASTISTPTITGLQSGTEIAIQGWQYDGAFSSTDADTVAWASGTLTLLDGTTYSITGANTGNMSALTYIYLDIGTSTTAFQTTTTASTAVGTGKILVAVAEDNAGEAATFQVFGGIGGAVWKAANIATNTLTANEIAANTITATEMNVSQLSAIAADLGTITAGTVTGGTIRTASSGARVELGTTGIKSYDSGPTQRVQILNDGSGWFGSSTDGVIWDTAGTLTVENVANLTTLTAGEALTAGDSIQMGFSVEALDLPPSDDTYTQEGSPTTNDGSAITFNCYNATGDVENRGYMKFDLTNIPATSANLTSATLRYYFTGINLGSTTLQLYELDADWAEGTLTWNNQPGLGSTIGGTSSYDSGTSVGYKTSDVTTIVGDWLDGDKNNYGFCFVDTSAAGANGPCTFSSKEASGTSQDPYLLLEFESGKVFKTSAINATNTAKTIGFCYANAAEDASVKCQVNGTFVTSGLTAGSVYYVQDAIGTIGTSAGTVSKKAGIALSTTKLLVDRTT